MRSTNIFESSLYSNVFICYKCLFMGGQNAFSVVSLSAFEKTCVLLELPFCAELNDLCPKSVYKSIRKLWSYNLICVILIIIEIRKRLIYCFSCYLCISCNLKTICNTALILLQNKVLGICNLLIQKYGFPKCIIMSGFHKSGHI